MRTTRGRGELAAVIQDDGREGPASVARAMRILAREYVPCAIKSCERSATHVGRNDVLVCRDHVRYRGQSIAAARARLNEALSR